MPVFLTTHNRTIAIVVGIALFVLLGINTLFNLMIFEHALISFAHYTSTGLAAFVGLYGAYKLGTQNFAGRALLFLGLASGASLLGYIIWDYHKVFLGIESSYPSLADLFFILFFPFAATGVILLLTMYRPQLRRGVIIEAFAVFAIFTIAILAYSGSPVFSEATFIRSLFDVGYTIADAIIISVAYIALRIARQRIFKGLLIYTVGMMVLALGDIISAIRVANETIYYGDITDILLIAGNLILVAGIYFTAQTFSNTNHIINNNAS